MADTNKVLLNLKQKKQQKNAIKKQVRETVTQYRYFYHVCYRFYKNTDAIAGMCDPAIQNYFGLYLFCKLSSVNTHTYAYMYCVFWQQFFFDACFIKNA